MSQITDQSAFETGQNQWPNFSYEELACQHCGSMNLSEDFLIALQELRETVDMPMTITSGYRCAEHPIEKKKSSPGQHQIGAIDISCRGDKAVLITQKALDLGWTGFGFQQKGSNRFVHLDRRPGERVMWSY